MEDITKQFDDLSARFAALERQQAAPPAPIKLIYAPKKLADFKGGAEQNVEEWIKHANDALRIQGLEGQEAADSAERLA